MIYFAALLLLPLMTLCGVPWRISALVARFAGYVWLATQAVHFVHTHVMVYRP